MDPTLSITIHDDVPHEAGRLIDAGLGAANVDAAPLQDVERISCFARLASGEVIGGAVGRTWGVCCELQQVWVDRAHRRSGLGTKILQAFQREAEQRGCRTFYLETFSFQAPSLYLKLGYEVRLEIRGFPEAIVKYVMVRESAPGGG